MGKPGSFVVQVDGRTVASKTGWDFPSDQQIVDAVAKALERKQG